MKNKWWDVIKNDDGDEDIILVRKEEDYHVVLPEFHAGGIIHYIDSAPRDPSSSLVAPKTSVFYNKDTTIAKDYEVELGGVVWKSAQGKPVLGLTADTSSWHIEQIGELIKAFPKGVISFPFLTHTGYTFGEKVQVEKIFKLRPGEWGVIKREFIMPHFNLLWESETSIPRYFEKWNEKRYVWEQIY